MKKLMFFILILIFVLVIIIARVSYLLGRVMMKQEPKIVGCGNNISHSMHEFYDNGMPKKVECWYIQINTSTKFL